MILCKTIVIFQNFLLLVLFLLVFNNIWCTSPEKKEMDDFSLLEEGLIMDLLKVNDRQLCCQLHRVLCEGLLRVKLVCLTGKQNKNIALN